MKILSFAVPCYNSEAYMRKCIDSLLPGGEDVEIIIVDDGSSDGTAAIADEYEAKYPGICRAIHQENAGHGGAVNTGITNARGMYFKVVDSDDWLDTDSYKIVLNRLKQFREDRKRVDMFICNYVYEHVEDGTSHTIGYHKVLPEEKIFGWDEARHFRMDQNLLMHSVIYRTKVLRESGLKLPKHTFYVDNLFVYIPLPYVKTLYYLDVDLYRYFIGRNDQSVNERVMISRIDQQLHVNKLMIDYMVENRSLVNSNKKRYRYMLSYLDIITTISSILLIRSGTEENLQKKQELWEYLKKKDWVLYKRLRFGLLGQCMNLPGKGGRMISVEGYKICQKFFGFN